MRLCYVLIQITDALRLNIPRLSELAHTISSG